MLESPHCEPVSKDGSKVRGSSTALLIAGDKLVGGGNGRLDAYNIRTGSKVGKETNWYRRGCADLWARLSIVTTHVDVNRAGADAHAASHRKRPRASDRLVA